MTGRKWREVDLIGRDTFESAESMTNRLLSFWNDIEEDVDWSSALISGHWGPIRLLVAVLVGHGFTLAENVELAKPTTNCCLTVIELGADKEPPGVIRSFAETLVPDLEPLAK